MKMTEGRAGMSEWLKLANVASLFLWIILFANSAVVGAEREKIQIIPPSHPHRAVWIYLIHPPPFTVLKWSNPRIPSWNSEYTSQEMFCKRGKMYEYYSISIREVVLLRRSPSSTTLVLKIIEYSIAERYCKPRGIINLGLRLQMHIYMGTDPVLLAMTFAMLTAHVGPGQLS